MTRRRTGTVMEKGFWALLLAAAATAALLAGSSLTYGRASGPTIKVVASFVGRPLPAEAGLFALTGGPAADAQPVGAAARVVARLKRARAAFALEERAEGIALRRYSKLLFNVPVRPDPGLDIVVVDASPLGEVRLLIRGMPISLQPSQSWTGVWAYPLRDELGICGNPPLFWSLSEDGELPGTVKSGMSRYAFHRYFITNEAAPEAKDRLLARLGL